MEGLPRPGLKSRRRLVCALMVLGAVAILGPGGLYLWDEYHYWAAGRDLERLDFAGGVKHLNRVWPKGAATHFLLARTARRGGAFDDAKNELAISEQLGAAGADTALESVLLGTQQGDLAGLDGALRQRALVDSPEAIFILEALAQGYLRTYRLEGALTCIKTLLERRPDHYLALLWHAQMMEYIHRDEEAVAEYQRILEVKPDERFARLSLADILLKTDRPREAFGHFEYLTSRWPDDPAVRLGMACCRRGLGQHDEARPLLAALLKEHPNEARVLYELGMLALAENSLHEAEDLMRRAHARSPANAPMMYGLYTCLERLKKTTEAAALREKMAQNDRDSSRLVELTKTVVETRRAPAARAEAGTLCLRLGMPDQAFSFLTTALQEDSINIEALEGLALYYAQTGEAARAAAYRQRAAQLKANASLQPQSRHGDQ
jgi:tetratricopeptide (TPR) repeat protein